MDIKCWMPQQLNVTYGSYVSIELKTPHLSTNIVKTSAPIFYNTLV